MKVECAACQAKYQIPDERVAGRKLKIRCRKCGGAIIVRGDQLVAPVEETTQQAPAGYGDGEWHVSLDGNQHGPYPTAQMASMLRKGQLAWDAYIWRDGYADWQTAGDSDTLVRAVAANADSDDDGPTRMVHGSAPPDELRPVARSAFAQRAAQRSSQPPVAVQDVYEQNYGSQPPVAAQDAYEQHYGSQPPVAEQQYAEQQYAEQQYAEQQYAEQQAAYGYSEQTEGYAADPYADGGEYGGYADPRVSAAHAMTGERHEDSVLFSAKNLQTSAAQSSPPQLRGGYAGGEGSGLIDIRALAQLARTSQPPKSSVNGTNGHSNGHHLGSGHARSDEVLALANQTGAFGRLDSLAPFDRPARASSNAVPLAIVAGSAMVAAAAFLGVYLTRDTGAVAVAPPAAVAATAQPIAQEPAAPAVAAALDQGEPEAEPEAGRRERADEAPGPEDEARVAAADREVAEAQKAAAPSRARARTTKRERPTRSAKTEERAEKEKPKPEKAAKADKPAAEDKKSASIDDLLLADAKPAPAPAAAEPAAPAELPLKKEPARSRSIDDLLDGAVDKSAKGEKKAAAADSANASASGVPETPSRDQVKAAMRAVEPKVKACTEGQTLESPSVTVALSVSGSSGKVSNVRVTGAQGAVSACIARAVGGATFPKFSKDALNLNFPFRLK